MLSATGRVGDLILVLIMEKDSTLGKKEQGKKDRVAKFDGDGWDD